MFYFDSLLTPQQVSKILKCSSKNNLYPRKRTRRVLSCRHQVVAFPAGGDFVSVWKDRNRGYWRFEFQYNKEFYRGGGYGTRREASDGARRETKVGDRRSQTEDQNRNRHGLLRIGQYLFGLWATKICYLDLPGQSTDLQTICETFWQFIWSYEITPRIVLDYLNQRPSANNFNVHRKEISAVFNYGIKVLQLKISNPCTPPIEKLPHTPEDKRPISEQEFLQIMAGCGSQGQP